jgi:hypothetical protein
MSHGARIFLGIALLAIALGFLAVAWFSVGTDLPIARPMIGMALFSALGAMACLVRVSQPVTIRIIGGIIFLVLLGGWVAMIRGGPVVGKGFATPSPVSATVGFLLIGLPCGYAAITGRYHPRGFGAAAFGARSPSRATSGGWTNPMQRMGQFDLTRLNGIGWLLLLGSFAVCIGGALTAGMWMEGKPNDADRRLILWTVALVILALTLGFFFGCRWLLGEAGISIYRR